jgi:RHS repeat-associated protein
MTSSRLGPCSIFHIHVLKALRLFALAGLASVLFAVSASAQNTYVPSQPDNMLTPADPIGVPPHVSTTGTNETINLSNGGLTVFVPALTLPQRGGWNITLGYFHNSNTWALRQDLTNVVAIDDDNSWGDQYVYDEWMRQVSPSWQVNLPTLKSSIEYVGDITAYNGTGGQTAQAPVFCVMDFVFTDWSGNQHSFTNTSECSASYNYWQGQNSARSPALSAIVQASDSTDGSWLKLNTSTLSDIQVTTKDGTVYHFTGYHVQWPSTQTPNNVGHSVEQCQTETVFPYCSTFSTMFDSNGNEVTYNSSTGVLTDTVGRSITISSSGISYKDSNGTQDTLSLSTTTSGSSIYTFPGFSCIAQKGYNVPWSDTINVHTTSGVNLPVSSTTTLTFPATDSTGTPRVYTMQFDQLGHLIEIQYPSGNPSGGYTQYDYQTGTFETVEGQNICSGLTMWEIKDKYECTITTGCSPSQQYQTTYTPTLQSGTYNGPPFNAELVETDITTGNYTQHDFGIPLQYVNYGPKETHVYYYKPTGSLLRDVQTAYIPTGCTNLDMELPGTITTTLDDVSPSISSQEVLQYESFAGYGGGCGINDNETEIDEYDYGASSPTRQTALTWMSGSDSSLYTDSGTHLLDRLKSRTVTDPATNIQETLNYGYNSVGDITSKIVGGTGVTSLTTSYQRDSYGNITQMTDPKNNVTNFGYTNNWYDSACTNLNPSAYLTSITDALGHVSKFSYYTCTGLKESAQDPNDIAASRAGTTFTYDALGRPRTVTRPDGGSTTYTYVDSTNNSNNGNSVTVSSSITASINKTQEAILDGFGRKAHTILTTDPDNPDTVDTTYDSPGRVASVSNPYRSTSDSTHGITSDQYDALNRTIQVTDPDNSVATTTYSGNITTVTDEVGKKRKSQTDALGRLTYLWEDPAGLNYQTNYTYDAFGNLLRVLQNSSRQRTFVYNAFNQLTSATNPESNLITYTYDNDGNVFTKTSYAENQTDGTPTYATGSVSITLSKYCQEGDCTSGTATITVGSYGAQVSYTQNESTSSLASALVSQLSFSSSPVTAMANGSTVNITSKISGPGGNYSLTTNVTGNNGVPASYVLTPSGSTLTGGSSPPTVTITYAYDKLNRLTSKTYTDGTPTVTYWFDGTAPTGCSPTLTYSNPIYRRTAMCDGPGWEAWSYNSTGHLLDDRRSTSSLVKDTLYAPNLDGSDASITYPITSRIITYTPGGAGLPLSASDGTTTYASAAHYTPQGALASLTNSGNIYSTFIYNSRLQPCWNYATTGAALQWGSATQCSTTATTGTILDMKYNFNLGAGDNGNVIGITNNRDTTRSQAFVYDSLNRIQTAGTVNTSGTNCWGETYGIDAWANLSSLALPSSYSSSCSHETPFSYTIPNNNQLPSASGFTYDAAGNLMASGLGNYVYNGEEQMTSATIGSLTTTYSYDGDGKRVEKSGGKIYWYGGGSDALVETDLSGNTNNSTFSEYVLFAGKRVSRRDYQNNVYYYFADHLGTSREMLQAGQTTPCYDADFYPYGGEITHTTTCTQNYKFTAKERDAESGLDNFGARYNSSYLGRFTSPDPVIITPLRLRDPQRFNLYGYARSSPMSYVDVNGQDIDLVNDTDKGRAEALAKLTQGMSKAEAENIGVKSDKNGKWHVVVKDKSAISAKGASVAYKGVAGVIGDHSITVSLGLVGGGLTATFPGIGQVSSISRYDVTLGTPGDRNVSAIITSGDVPGCCKVLTPYGEMMGSEPDFVAMYHEVVGETLEYRAGHADLVADPILNSNTVIKIENELRRSLGMYPRTGSDHGEPVITVRGVQQ